MIKTAPAVTKKKRMNAHDRRQMIIEKASHLFAQRGMFGVTTKEIALACDVSEPVLYQHFETKKDLYDALQCLCQGQTFLAPKMLASRKPSVETFCLIVYMLNTMIIHARIPGGTEKSIEAENLTRLAGFSFLDDGSFMKVLLRDCIGVLFDDWVKNYEVALKEGALELPAANRQELWLTYEMMIGSALFNLNGDHLLSELHRADDYIERTSLFMLRGLGVKKSVLDEAFKPREWDRDFQNLVSAPGSSQHEATSAE